MTAEHVSRYNDAVRAESCYFCPAESDLQTHHIVPQRKNGSDREENLVIVCADCHSNLEALYDKRFYERLGLSDDSGEQRSHFACTIPDCDEPATMRVQNAKGFVDWWCEDHGEPQADADNATVLQEVTA